ncbi:hypothetical protein JCM14635_20350 [Megalodesulfovibrio paquesii]
MATTGQRWPGQERRFKDRAVTVFIPRTTGGLGFGRTTTGGDGGSGGGCCGGGGAGRHCPCRQKYPGGHWANADTAGSSTNIPAASAKIKDKVRNVCADCMLSHS